MTIQIKIENFQNIESLALRVEGFCVLVGESNIGKSSVVRSIRCLTENTPAKAFMRKDKSGKVRPAKVQVAFPATKGTTLKDGSPAKAVLVEWERDKSVSYKVTKVSTTGQKEVEPFERVGRGVPEPVASLGLLRMSTPELQALIGLIPQGRYFWPLDDPNSVVKLIGELRSVVALNTALNTAKTDRRGVKKEEDFHVRVSTDASAALQKYAGSGELDVLLAKAESADHHLIAARAQVREFSTIHERLRTIKQSYDPVKAELAKLKDCEKLTEILSGLSSKAYALQLVKGRVVELKKLSAGVTRAREAIHPVPDVDVPDVQPLETLSSRLIDLRSLRGRVARAESAVKPVPAIEIPSFEKAEGASDRAQTLRGLELRYHQAVDGLVAAETETDLLFGENDSLEQEFSEFQQEHPNCPLCGSGLEGVGLSTL